MKKSRVEALTDAIVAIIMTIMVLDFRVPTTPHFYEIFDNVPELFAYIVSFIFIGVAWYNQHFMFYLVKRITKKIYWANNLWLFTMSLIPIVSAWVGKFMNDVGPQLFYLLFFTAWNLAYLFLAKVILNEMKHEGDQTGIKEITEMCSYRFLTSWGFPLLVIGTGIAILIFPFSGLVFSLIEIIINGIYTTPDGDKLEGPDGKKKKKQD
ncbi:TMEM175 family protein [Fructilactobacillus myrtifloralis]|uniref:TMEM175 family protein n=1 Tax=Fructilactobacillus myrtifloralis TaxID=2940301 RepID=A0ABY5BP38_9LACO|nr:TMEM175 family protein [Fructilactobacillus myrtifloralis]USS85455.1 TMEM175 family protein [Fructilactobacillus myrtifloralis]